MFKKKKNSQNKIKAHMGSHKHTHVGNHSRVPTSAYFKSQVLFFVSIRGRWVSKKKEKKEKERKVKALILLSSPPRP